MHFHQHIIIFVIIVLLHVYLLSFYNCSIARKIYQSKTDNNVKISINFKSILEHLHMQEIILIVKRIVEIFEINFPTLVISKAEN